MMSLLAMCFLWFVDYYIIFMVCRYGVSIVM